MIGIFYKKNGKLQTATIYIVSVAISLWAIFYSQEIVNRVQHFNLAMQQLNSEVLTEASKVYRERQR